VTFQAGQSGNPGGRPKEAAVVKALAREHTETAIKVLADALSDPDGRVRIAAANSLLDRGYGKSAQAIVGDEDMPPIQHSLTVKRVKPGDGN
jgi:HEAT repeat protein